MNIDQWTIKAQEALQAAPGVARDHSHKALPPLPQKTGPELRSSRTKT
jgi:hypothetical protein